MGTDGSIIVNFGEVYFEVESKKHSDIHSIKITLGNAYTRTSTA